MFVIQRVMVCFPRSAAVDICTPQFLRCNCLARGRFDQWRTTQENSAVALHNNSFIAHRWHIRPASSTRTHDYGNLWDTLARHTGLIIEDPPEVVAVRKDLGLQW